MALDKKITDRFDELRKERESVAIDDELAARDVEQREIQFLLDLVPIARKYDETCDDDAAPQPKPAPVADPGGILGFVKRETGQRKGALLREYMRDVEKQVVRGGRLADPWDYMCKECDVSLLIVDAEASAVCPLCGMCSWAWDVYSNNLSYEEEIGRGYSSYYAYKKINHFSEWLSSVQAKENTKIPEEVLDALRAEYKKIRVSRASQITPSKTKEFLKKLKLTKYYEHVHYITNLLNNIPSTSIPTALEDKLKLMFQEIQGPWERTKPKNRSNFFSYSYVLHKFCELLGADEYLRLFPLLKSAEKLYQQDQMWKAVCKELGWEFRSSV